MGGGQFELLIFFLFTQKVMYFQGARKRPH
jgi:hypothetical protein